MKTNENPKLDYLKRRKAATAPGTFPGMNRARKFVDRKKQANKNSCRKPTEE